MTLRESAARRTAGQTARHVAAAALAVLLGALLLPPTTTTAQDDTPPATTTRAGRGENEIVLIHGLGANASVWDGVAPYLRGTMKVWTYELHGHGETPPLRNPSIDAEAAALGKFLQEQDLPYPTLVGHGMGALIAMRFAFDHPADVYRLIVIDAAPRQLATDEQKEHIARSLAEDYDRFVAARYLGYSPNPAVADRIVDMALKTDSLSFISLLMSSFDFDLTDELPKQSVPILVIGSEMLFPQESDARAILDQIGFDKARTVSFKRIPFTGHYVMLESPVNLASVILAFAVYDEYR
jgi:pimeloyl-ACP methyl ester carboxylesterase